MLGMAGSVNLNRFVVFVAVVETGSFTAAARRLGLTKGMISQHVARLEAEIGASLLVRTTRRLTPTAAGDAFFDSCRRLLAEAEDAIARAGADSSEAVGTLRLTAPGDYAATVLAPVVAEFGRRHPRLRIEMVVADRILDLVADNLDLAIRVGWLDDSSHRATRIGGFQQMLVAGPGYVERHGQPAVPADVAGHRWVALSILRQPLRWSFDGREVIDVVVAPALSATTPTTVHACVLAGAGLSVLPDYLVAADVAAGRLVRLLPDWRLPEGGIHALLPATRYPPAKVRLFVEFLKAWRGPDGFALASA